MPFTETEKGQIRSFLGYSELYPDANTAVYSAISIIEQSPEAVVAVQLILSRLEVVDTALDSKAISTAGLASVGTGDPEFYEGGKLKDLRSIGRGLCQKLSIKTGIDIARDYFGTSSNMRSPAFFG